MTVAIAPASGGGEDIGKFGFFYRAAKSDSHRPRRLSLLRFSLKEAAALTPVLLNLVQSNAAGDRNLRIISSSVIGITFGRCTRISSRVAAIRRVLQHREYTKSRVSGSIRGNWELRESVVEVRRVNDKLMTIKVVVGGSTLNVISAYAPQTSLDEEVKRRFWAALDEVVQGIPPTEKLFIGGDFNGHIGSSAGGYGEVHGGFGFGDRNGGGTSLLDFARAFELVIVNSMFPKREKHLVTFRSMVANLLLKRCDRGLCEDCKVIRVRT
ncbi:PREDICTED: uncharacterized protein LOC109206279 [Nicotiana attenuata]|uniref:uncharacterized protein LOC109206279 n=1 Tax=Nicotiana attenuata TaxID=49451 RepID=UPI0009057AFD|nr:PREDICTED: uncharacterized protein LOC109206279 [Nicotiana attenuata]